MQLCFIYWMLPTCMATSMLPGCTHLLFPFLHAEKFPFSTFSHATKEIADICMQAWRMSLTKTVCQTLSLMLIDGLTLLYNWHHGRYQRCEIWDLSTLADKLRIVFKTSKLKLAWWQCMVTSVYCHLQEEGKMFFEKANENVSEGIFFFRWKLW